MFFFVFAIVEHLLSAHVCQIGTKYLVSTQTDSSHIIAHTWMVVQAEEYIFGKALQEACSNNIALNTLFIGPFMFLRLFWMLYQKS